MCTERDIFIAINHTSKYQFILKLDMEKKRSPDPRFNEFTEQLDEYGKPIGFVLEGNDFVFKYDEEGGWVDEDGNYYNSEGILQSDGEYLDDESLSDQDDEQLDEFQDLLRREEEGIIIKPAPKEQKKEEPEGQSPKNKKEENDNFDYKKLVAQYKNKQLLREGLPGHLFIYFKQKSAYFQKVEPSVEKQQSTQKKNEEITLIQKKVEEARQALLKENTWLSQPGVFLECSGDSQVQNYYERYWYGRVQTTAEKYLEFIDQISKSSQFNLLSYKTYFALRSKFYLKKSQAKVISNIKELQEKFEIMSSQQAIVIRLDNLPENYPLSFVFDLIEYVGGKWEEVEEAHVVDEFAAELVVLKETALKLANLQAYNHDKGEFIELSVKDFKKRVTNANKPRFYYVQVEGKYKLHERQLFDTLALMNSKEGVAKNYTEQEYKDSKVRFAVGSADALRKVLMFRGISMNTVHIWADPKGAK